MRVMEIADETSPFTDAVPATILADGVTASVLGLLTNGLDITAPPRALAQSKTTKTSEFKHLDTQLGKIHNFHGHHRCGD